LVRCAAIYAENAKKQWVVWLLVNRISLDHAAIAGSQNRHIGALRE
jgi:hypothetical protein